jgi:DNA-binding transcriptional LysR family regulator
MPLILSSRYTPFRRYVEGFAAAAGKELHVVRELEVSFTQLAVALEGEGATILPLSHCYEEIANGLVVARLIDEPVMYRQILMAFGSKSFGHLVKAAARLFKETIAAHGAICGWLSPQSERALAS